MTLVILVADGARPDGLFGAMDAGELPALAALRARGMSATLTSVFPSVTGSAYTPFLLGLHPGQAGLVGLRWFDRAREATSWPAFSRSYVGLGGMRADTDLTRELKTLFEHEPRSIGGWMRFDRWLGEEFVRRIVAQKPRVAFLAHPGIDKISHRFGSSHPRVLDAMRTVDNTVRLLEEAFAHEGRSDELEVWVVSDHGHADVPNHEDLEGRIRGWGYRVRSHPWVHRGRDVAVMVSGNAMAHLYLELHRKRRAVWPALRDRWNPFLQRLLELPSIDLAIVPMGDSRLRVHSRERGAADVFTAGDGCHSYRRDTGDPLRLGKDLLGIDANAIWERTRDSEYPDSLVQLCAITASSRSGDIIVSAARGWDLRTRYEPVLHTSGHGALLREQMLVPFVSSRPLAQPLRRTVDLFPAALARLRTP